MVAAQIIPAADLYVHAGQAQLGLDLLDEIIEELTDLWQTPLVPAQIRITGLALGIMSTMIRDQSQSERSAAVERGSGYVAAARAIATDYANHERSLGAEGEAWQRRVEAEWLRLRWLADVDAPDLGVHIAAWEHAIEGFSYGDRYETARCQLRLAGVLRGAGHGPQAAELATVARDTAHQLGALPLQAEVRALGTERRGEPDRATGAQSLTTREREVLALLEEGRTNRQLARQLYISEKTVSVHVSNILAKLGAGSRAEAAAIARRDGIS
jgi:DNA-binding NarL/FixJ family response regulator